MRRPPLGWGVVLLLAVPIGPGARAELGRPELAVRAGGLFAASSGLSRDGDTGGGLTMGASVLWPWGDRFRFGVTGFSADFGSRLLSVEGLGGSEEPRDLGEIEAEHRGAWGAGWRVDAVGRGTPAWGRAFATLSYQAAWFGADAQGRAIDTRSAMAATLAAGWERPLGERHTVALAVGPTFLTARDTERFTSAHLEWRWRP